MEQATCQETAPPSSGTKHRRTASSVKTTARPPGAAVISLFVINLRFLNLDLLPDWPGITIASFGSQDARTRTRCTEFALFQLFRLYDPATTADKLQPFYPPLEPLQSINLRAALYRCLNELKKNGVLGKETVLRKTMLDECTGDKFWELCLGLSAIVLRKVTLEKRNSRYGRPVAERLGTAQGMSKSQRESLLPLSIAHRAALGKVLEEKRRKRETYVRLYDVLVEKEAELLRRKAQVQEQARSRPSRERVERLEGVERTVKKGWVGSKELQSVLVHGDVSASGDGLLTRPWEQIISSGSASEPNERGLLECLHQTASKQSQRVRRWQSMHQKLLLASKQASSGPTSLSDDDPSKPTPPLRFDKHRTLSTLDAQHQLPTDDPPRHRSESNASNASRYDDILTSMREDLRHRTRRATGPEQQPPVAPPTPTIKHPSKHSPRKLRTHTLDTTAGAPAPAPAPTDLQARSPLSSTTSAPFRPGIGRRASSRSKSYQQPKVESQRQFIPLKSELFSPLKTTQEQRRGSGASPLSSSSLVASPVEEEEGEDGGGLSPERFSGGEGGRRVSRSSEGGGKVDSGVGLGISQLSVEGGQCRGHVKTGRGERLAAADEEEAQDVIAVPDRAAKTAAVAAASSEAKPTAVVRPSLAERTRMSMAFRSTEDISGNGVLLPEPPSHSTPTNPSKHDIMPPPPPTSKGAHHTAQEQEEEEEDNDKPTSLLDRTRHSISLAPPTKKKSTPGHSRARSSITYPVNQFATPQKRRSSLAVDHQQQQSTPPPAGSAAAAAAAGLKRDITPREQLFSPEAQYDSVFKPRPKVALSPVLSPVVCAGDDDSGEGGGGRAERCEEMSLCEVGRSEPIMVAGMGGARER